MTNCQQSPGGLLNERLYAMLSPTGHTPRLTHKAMIEFDYRLIYTENGEYWDASPKPAIDWKQVRRAAAEVIAIPLTLLTYLF